MKHSLLAVTGIVCLLPGVLLRGGLAQDSAGQAKRDWSRRVITGRLIRFADIDTRVPGGSPYYPSPTAVGSVPNLRSFALTGWSFVPAPRLFAVRPFAVKPDTADAWNTGSGNWSVAGNWTAGVPTGTSAVTIGNTTGATVTEDLASASAASLAITNGNELYIAPGNTLTVAGATTVSAGTYLQVGTGQGAGSTLNSGALTNSGEVQIGNYYMTSPSTLNVTGTYTGTAETVVVQGGNTAGANSLLNVSGAAPGTVTGTYTLLGELGSATMEFGSGGITQIGSGADVTISGSNAYLEVGATNSNSALKGLTTIASSAELYLENGASVTTTGALTVSGGLFVDGTSLGGGGSSLTLGGPLTNNSEVSVGNYYTGAPDTLKVTGTYTGTGATLFVTGGNYSASANSLVNVTGAAPTTVTGNYELTSYEGSAAVEWGSGGITAIGDGGSNAGYVALDGASAYLEVGATNTNSALKGLTTIASNGNLQIANGVSVTTTGALTVAAGGGLGLDVSNTGGGSSLTLGGSLTNSSTVQVGNYYTSAPDTLKVTGTYTGTGATLNVIGGNYSSGANSLVNITGAAPTTVTGNYELTSYEGSAAVEWGSGGITAIGDGGSNAGYVGLNGASAYVEVGANNTNSALKGLTTIASNGELQIANGVSVTTTGALTVSAGGLLYVDAANTGGGSSLTLGGSLTNDSTVQVGNYYTSSADTLKVTGTYTGTGATLTVVGGNYGAGANSLVNVTGAAPATALGNYYLTSNEGSAAVEWGSGGITAIGDGSSNPGDVSLNGASTYLEVGATNSNSALNGLTTIASNGGLQLANGASVSTTGALTVAAGGSLSVDGGSSGGGSSLTLGGSLTNDSTVQVGNYYTSLPDTLKVTGTYTGTGATLEVEGGNYGAGANSLVNVTGAAPGTITGNYELSSNEGSAAVEWGSGGITSIGNGSTEAGYVALNGPSTYLEVGATNSNSALKTLTTIASNGELQMENGAAVTTTGALTVAASGQLYLDANGNGGGGSSLTLGGSLTNSGAVQVGNYYTNSADTLKVTGTYTGTGGTLTVEGGNYGAGANSLVNVTGAAPGTITGNYELSSNEGSAAVEWGSGGITAIGDGGSNAGNVSLNGASAYLEVGATNSNSALKTLTTIASNGELQLANGASVTTTGALTVAAGGQLYLDASGNNGGGSSLNIGAALTNSGAMQVGNYYMSSATTASVGGSLTNTSTGVINLDAQGYNGGTANAVLEVTGPNLVNSGAINLNGNTGDAELEINGNVALSGTGKINLSNIATNVITGVAGTDTLTNSSTIQGSGTIGGIGIVNHGTILANQSTPILILPSSLGLNNQGTLSVLTGDTMQIGTSVGGALTNFSGTTLTGGTYSVGGTMKFGATGASIVTDAASISLTGAGAQLINFGGTSLLTNLATITSAGSFTLGSSWGTFTTTGNFTNNGTLSVGAADKFIVDLSDSLTNFSGTTLTGGTYKITGTLEFNGANIVTNDASITLTGAGSKIDGKAGANGLANFAVNAAGASFTLGKGRSFTTAGNFTNNGYLSIAAGDTFDVNGNLTNFSGSTLTGGDYSVSGILEFNGANIVTNAANITLGSTTAKIENQTAANAMLGFTTNTAAGKFTLSGDATLTTTGASFSNAGTVTVSTGSTFTIGGSNSVYTQTGGTTTVDGTLAGSGTSSLDLNGGNLYGAGTVDDGVTDAATVTPGNSATSTGKLQVNGGYTQSTGALDVTIGGTTAGTKYDQLNVSGTATLGGTLNITLAAGYTPPLNSTFDIVTATSINGSFATVTGVAINSNEHFTVTTVNNDEIVLTVVSGAAVTNSASLAQWMHPGLVHPGLTHHSYGLDLHTAQPHFAMLAAPAIRPAMLARIPQIPQMPLAAASRLPMGMQGFRPMDDLGSSAAPLAPAMTGDAGVAGSLGMSAVSAAAYNPMASMNHMRFECGVDLKALLKTSRKQLLRGLWAAPDSPEAVNIGYMTLTTR